MKISIEGLHFRYKPHLPLIENLSLHVTDGSIVAITGASGCGKSTFLQLILGLLKPQAGQIIQSSRVLNDAQTFVPPEARSIGVVFQDYALFPHLTVRENIGFGLRDGKKAKQEAIDSWLKLFALSEVAFSYPHQLSGGQMQRVAIARAIAPQPKLLLLDEPFSNLDRVLTERIRQELKPIFQALNMTIILVTHHQEDAVYLADTIIPFSTLMKK